LTAYYLICQYYNLPPDYLRVPREVVWWALRVAGVEEWIVKVIQAMYDEVTTAVRLRDGDSKEFGVKVGVHQGSVLSPLLFTIVLEALSKEFRCGLPWELLYADDLDLMAESEEELMEKFHVWKSGMEDKGLRVNMGKTKIMVIHPEPAQSRKPSGKWPCGVCGKGVGSNSILCPLCGKWIHKRCSGVKGSLESCKNFQCEKCMRGVASAGVTVSKPKYASDGLEYVDSFCYLGDMLSAGGGAEEAVRCRVRCAWGKFKELLPIITSRGTSLIVKGKIYKACVQTVMIYGSETWAMKVEDSHKLERTEASMMRWMCGVSLKKRLPTEELRRRLNIDCVSDVVRRGRLRWFGHVERKDSEWVKKCMDFKVDGCVGRGRPKKTWLECVNADMIKLGIRELAQDRSKWRSAVHGKRPNCGNTEKRTLNDR
jgi:Reverse transcriptase (RNA-dependent DNA polymerase)